VRPRHSPQVSGEPGQAHYYGRAETWIRDGHVASWCLGKLDEVSASSDVDQVPVGDASPNLHGHKERGRAVERPLDQTCGYQFPNPPGAQSLT
jgi:hypothetical protein